MILLTFFTGARAQSENLCKIMFQNETQGIRSLSAQVIRQNFLTRTENEHQKAVIQKLMEKGFLKSYFYEAALKLKTQGQARGFQAALESSQVFSLPTYYWLNLWRIRSPFHEEFFLNLLKLKENLSESLFLRLLEPQTEEIENLTLKAFLQSDRQENLIRSLLRVHLETEERKAQDQLAFQRLLMWRGFDSRQTRLFQALQKRYERDLDVRWLAEMIATLKKVEWSDGKMSLTLSTHSTRYRFAVFVAGLNSNVSKLYYGNATDNLNTATGRLLYGILLGVARKAYLHPDILDLQFTGQNIVNRNLAKTLQTLGFRLQFEPDREHSVYDPHDTERVKGGYWSLSLFSPRPGPSEVLKLLTLQRLEENREPLEEFSSIPSEEFTDIFYQITKLMAESGQTVFPHHDSLMKIKTLEQYQELANFLETRPHKAALEQRLSEILQKRSLN
jgi:hypothetical protein